MIYSNMEDEAKARKLDSCRNQLQMIKHTKLKTAKFSKKRSLRQLNSQRKVIKTTCTGSSSFDLKVA
jgi:hypothetical protein